MRGDESELLGSHAAEEAVLGAVLLDGAALGVAQEAGLKAGHFAGAGRRAIWEAVEALDQQGVPIDAITLGDHLEREGLNERTGGLVYLLDLVGNVPSAVNAGAYAAIVVEKAQARRWFTVLTQARQVFLDPDCANPIAQAQVLLQGLDSVDGTARFVSLRDALQAEVRRLDHQFNNPGIHGLQTGYHNIDHRLGGLQAGELVVVGARPGMGKTAYALNILRQVALQRQPGAVLAYSLEMTTGALVQRLIAAQGKIKKDLLRSAQVFDHGDSTVRLTAAVQVLRDLDVRVCDQPGLAVRDIRNLSLAEKRRSGVRLVIVDYLGLVEHEGRERSTADQIGEVTRTLKRLARELDCPVLLLAQLNREVDKRANKRPVLPDLRDSGSIEQDADVVQFLYRDEYYNPENTQWPGQVEVITAKVREGEIGSDYLTWEGKYQLMSSNSTYDQAVEQQAAGADRSAGADWYADLPTRGGR